MTAADAVGQAEPTTTALSGRHFPWPLCQASLFWSGSGGIPWYRLLIVFMF